MLIEPSSKIYFLYTLDKGELVPPVPALEIAYVSHTPQMTLCTGQLKKWLGFTLATVTGDKQFKRVLRRWGFMILEPIGASVREMITAQLEQFS